MFGLNLYRGPLDNVLLRLDLPAVIRQRVVDSARLRELSADHARVLGFLLRVIERQDRVRAQDDNCLSLPSVDHQRASRTSSPSRVACR
jgi:hypothetical protein